jgi:regulator of protease activity HflC (stomatin/prohibitin superfamily)
VIEKLFSFFGIIRNNLPIALVILYILTTWIKILKEHERIAIFRLGRFIKVAGPGLVLIFSPIDKGIKVNLNELIQGWQGYSQIELEEKIKEYVLSNNTNP